jgi:deoxyribodipyrimidine photo-lyase
MNSFHKTLVWFRRDLRCFDHAALHSALAQSAQVYCVFVFDRRILDELPREDRRVEFIRASVVELEKALHARGGALIVLHAHAEHAIPELARRLGVETVFTNRDYEPAACRRDESIARTLARDGIALRCVKDQVIFECDEVLSQSGKPFSVFTPYKNAWLKQLQIGEDALRPHEVDEFSARLAAPADHRRHVPSLQELGFLPTNFRSLELPAGMQGGQALFDQFKAHLPHYDRARDFPAVRGTSMLSVHLRFGTVSVRGLVRRALQAMRQGNDGSGGSGASTWLSELIWRDFYFMILHHHPHVAECAFRPEYDAIAWERGAPADADFDAWCEGRTGYPLVDAAMTQLNSTGYMHNRLRMVTASFLIKDLGIDWRRGERYFAEKLNDYDLAANNGGWQWAASSGCDAQPYFRIFNPVTQSEKFDPDGRFIRHYLPQLARLSNRHIHAPWRASLQECETAGIALGKHYPLPIVQHEEARQRTLQRYAVVKNARSLPREAQQE